MTERERLIEVLNNNPWLTYLIEKGNVKSLADYLLKNNVNFVEQGRNITENHPVDEFVCSECGFICEGWTEVVYDPDGEYSYYCECVFDFCPKCGSKIEDFWKDEEENK